MSFTGNIGMLFTRTYFKDYRWEGNDLKFNNLKDHFETLKSASLSDFNIPDPVGNKKQGFRLTTIYPGLLAGSGIAHDVKAEEALKLGMSFDQTTGLPCIPGSSVKGVLRNALQLDKGGYVKELLTDIIGAERANNLNVSDLEKEIFEPEDKPIYERDIFHDAFPTQSANPDAEFLVDDYITPHINRKHPKLSPFTDPVPISFLKVLPQVTVRFDFDLKDGTEITADEKRKFFKQILLDLGIGAKTNVGYGQFEENIPEQKKEKTPQGKPMLIIPKKISEISKDENIHGILNNKTDKYWTVAFEYKGEKCQAPKAIKPKHEGWNKGDKVILTIQQPFKNNEGRILNFNMEKV